MDSISAIASVRAPPVARALGSFKSRPPVLAVVLPCAGVGVAATLLPVLPKAGKGAAGVEMVAGAGVEGGLAGVEVESEAAAAGATFGYGIMLDSKGVQRRHHSPFGPCKL